MKTLLPLCILLLSITAQAQLAPLSSFPRKGSYLYFKQPAYEDNSFLLDEAFTQPKGVIQNIVTFYVEDVRKGNYATSFTQQIPINDRHQVGYTLNYSVVNSDRNERNAGFGDLYLHYSFALLGKKDQVMIVPAFTLIVPTGKNRGYGGWGGQFVVAATKRLTPKVTTHFNIGYSYIAHADYITTGSSADRTFFEEDLHLQNAAASVIWYTTRKFNLLLESTAGASRKLADNSTQRVFNLTLNPGFRVLLDNGKAQLVPGMSIPLNFENSKFLGAGLFLYLSYEPDYLDFFKAKGR